ncbi:uncharacterized protein LOC109839447 [Asparagus officinalis]|uniref:uncharacterized protein LOC109839447 n=1 Tax=Asparagus officinalis TaxID=4686 RepID=UPI00098E19C4|nr:uncharacterized protein LOC109839447 [Asparagus officinalis]
MINWVMECISTPKYSLALNGSLHGYFKGKRGLRQGDPLSPYLFVLGMEYLSRSLNALRNDNLFKYHPKCQSLGITHLIFADDLLLFAKADGYSIMKLFYCLKEFSRVSGLEANPAKCSIYFSGVDDGLKNQVCSLLNFPEGMLPIHYLGLPLISKRLSYLDCSPLLSKISEQFLHWQKKKCLSYAGRIQLIKSVIMGIQIFWTSNYILPVKVLEKIDRMCSDFLWNNKIHLVSWESICRGKEQGGLGLYSPKSWNHAVAIKLLWMIHQKKDMLWIKWIHENYVHQTDIWHIQSKASDSWLWRRLLKIRDMAVSKFGSANNLINTINNCHSGGKFLISSVYKALISFSPPVPWFNTVWERLNYPKHSFVLWLASQSRLLTQDRLCKMNIITSNQCVLCPGHHQAEETCQHLFFDCPYSAQVWNNVMDWMNFSWRSCNWLHLFDWYNNNLRGKGFKKKLKRMVLAVTVYLVWQERNLRAFQGKSRDPVTLFRLIKFTVFTKILNDDTLNLV